MIELHGAFMLPYSYYLLATGLTSVVTLVLSYHALVRLRRARWVEDTPTSRIRSAAQGLVELHGRLDAGGHAALLSPLGSTECLWYRFRVEEYRRYGNNGRWHLVEQGVSDRPFLLRDDTGACWIMPQGALVHARQRRRWEGNQRWPAGSSLRTGLLGTLIGRRYRYTEEWFQEDDILYALGWFESRGGGREAVDQQAIARQVISQWKADYPDLLARFDRNGDGQLDLQEWDAVRVAAAAEAARQAKVAGQSPVVHGLRKPPHGGLPFMLSDHHEQDLSRKLRQQSFWSLAGMLLSASVAGWLWFALV